MSKAFCFRLQEKHETGNTFTNCMNPADVVGGRTYVLESREYFFRAELLLSAGSNPPELGKLTVQAGVIGFHLSQVSG